MTTISHYSKPKRVFAGLLAVWMSGIVFLLCCGAMPKAARESAEMESCPLAKAGHCHKSSSVNTPIDGNALRFEANRNDDSTFECCGFLPRFFDKVRKGENIQLVAVLPARAESTPATFAFVRIKSNAFFGYRPRPLNRSGTYLKNRVFRI